jgi:hypothetical protein
VPYAPHLRHASGKRTRLANSIRQGHTTTSYTNYTLWPFLTVIPPLRGLRPRKSGPPTAPRRPYGVRKALALRINSAEPTLKHCIFSRQPIPTGLAQEARATRLTGAGESAARRDTRLE